jgi:hypothetical protein
MATKTAEKPVQKASNGDFELPTKISVPEINMQSCILFGLPKCGKTTLLSKLPNCLIIDTENGTNKISAIIKKVPEDRGPVGKMKWLDDFADYLISEGKPYDYIALDTLTEVNELAEWSGTYRYMLSAQGKGFNRDDDGVALLPSSDDYQSVHTLGQGYGYRWSREDTLRIFEKYKRVVKKCIFYVCHVEDKYMATIENTEVLLPKQLALTGKLRNILPRKVDAIGYVYNEEGVIKINFTGSEDRIGGNRCEHLRGYNDIADWNKIFI